MKKHLSAKVINIFIFNHQNKLLVSICYLVSVIQVKVKPLRHLSSKKFDCCYVSKILNLYHAHLVK